ncbi:MAG: SRPBCC family protein [Dehalococcoidia bacterium]
MSRIVKSIQIDAPQDQVFTYAADVDKQAEWVVFIKEIKVTSGDGQSRGTTDRCVAKLGLRTQVLEAEWTEFRPPDSFGRRITSGAKMEGRIAFAPQDGGTRVQWNISYKAPHGMLGSLVDVFFMNRVFQNEVEESLENLKKALEA